MEITKARSYLRISRRDVRRFFCDVAGIVLVWIFVVALDGVVIGVGDGGGGGSRGRLGRDYGSGTAHGAPPQGAPAQGATFADGASLGHFVREGRVVRRHRFL